MSRYIPRPEEIPSGLCECGCGGTTEIAARTNHQFRWFMGHPKPYIKGHHTRVEYFPKGSASHKWKGGRWMHKSGYIYVYTPDHPSANRDGYVLEHRLVAEQLAGRIIRRGEHVHHMNENRADNRPENLKVLSASEHAKLHAPDFMSHLTHDVRSTAARKAAVTKGHDALADAGRKGAAAQQA